MPRSLLACALLAACGLDPVVPDPAEPNADEGILPASELEDAGLLSEIGADDTSSCTEAEDGLVSCTSALSLPSPKYAAVFRGGSTGKTVLGTDWASFSSQWSTLSSQGYRLVDLDTYSGVTGQLYSGAFVPGSGAHYLWVGVDWASLTSKWTELGAQGQRLVDLETWVEGGTRRWAGVWRAGNDGYYLWAGVDWNSLVAKWKELAPQGLRLVDLEVYEHNGALRYAGVWRGGSGGYALWAGVGWNAFAKKWLELSQSGLRLVDLEAYTAAGRRLYAGVFAAGTDGYELVGASSSSVLTSKIQSLGAAGKQLVRLEIDAGQDQPPPAFAAAFADVLDNQAIGYSFAVVEDGVVTSAGGAGYARAPWESSYDGVAMTGQKRVQLASVSKSITAVTLIHLFAEKGLSLDTPFFPYVASVLPAPASGVGGITVRQLLNHKTGLVEWGYCGPDLYASLGDLVKQPLAGTPGVTQKYSNGNFCLARAVVEQVSGQSYVDYVKAEVLAPLGITAMSCKPDTTAPALYYKRGDFSGAGYLWSDDYTGHCAAYGWYASAEDLGKFLKGVRYNLVLTEAQKLDAFATQLGFWSSNTDSGKAYQHNGAWITGDGRGANTAIVQLPKGKDAVLLINTNGYLNDQDYFKTVGTLVTGFNNLP